MGLLTGQKLINHKHLKPSGIYIPWANLDGGSVSTLN